MKVLKGLEAVSVRTKIQLRKRYSAPNVPLLTTNYGENCRNFPFSAVVVVVKVFLPAGTFWVTAELETVIMYQGEVKGGYNDQRDCHAKLAFS